MNPIKAIKLYLRWKPQIEEVESAVKDAQGGRMKEFWQKIAHVAEPILWSTGSGAFLGAADYLQEVAQKCANGCASLDWRADLVHLGVVFAAGAAAGAKLYFLQPKAKAPDPQN